MEYINAFWVGGLICALVQILLEKTKLLPGRVMVLLVCTGAVLGSVGIYEKGSFGAWIFRRFHGRIYCQCGGDCRSADFFLSGKSDF